MNYTLISGFSDEISPSIKEQFEELNKLGINYFEPRGIDGKNISKLTEEEMYALKETDSICGFYLYQETGTPIGDNLIDSTKRQWAYVYWELDEE